MIRHAWLTLHAKLIILVVCEVLVPVGLFLVIGWPVDYPHVDFFRADRLFDTRVNRESMNAYEASHLGSFFSIIRSVFQMVILTTEVAILHRRPLRKRTRREGLSTLLVTVAAITSPFAALRAANA